MKKGFTILELLVASLLLSMLVTTLSMMFNQSSIAWRTGMAGVVELNTVRSHLGVVHDVQDELLPGVGDKTAKAEKARSINYRTVSLWKKNADNQLRSGSGASGRAFEQVNWGDAPRFGLDEAQNGATLATSLGSKDTRNGQNAYIVGVRSAGPDKKWDTEDDVTNWPEEVE